MFASAAVGIPSAGDLAWHAPVVRATTAALPAAGYVIGAPSTLTAAVNGALPTIDGEGSAVGDRILVKDQASTPENGIYEVVSLGSGASPWQLRRTADADTAAELPRGSVVFVVGGILNNGRLYVETLVIANIDVSNQAWQPIGAGLAIVRTVFAANGTWNYPTSPRFLGVNVRVVAGGGGGGGAVLTGAGQGSGGSGGGGGGYAERFIDAATLTPINRAVTVGLGGVANVGAAGGPGGNSSFGGLVTAGSGAGGTSMVATAASLATGGGQGGIGTIGDILVRGDDGENAATVGAAPLAIGAGGGTPLGGSTRGVGAGTAGRNGWPFGGGGSGVNNGAAAAARAGGAGADGVVIVDELYGA